MAASRSAVMGADNMISKPEIVWSVATVFLLGWFVWTFIANDLPDDFLSKWAEDRKKAREERKNKSKK